MILLLAAVHTFFFVILAGNLVYLHRGRRARAAARGRVSVLIPARNEADNLRRLVPSLLAQDHPDLEIILYDDASEDATREVLATFEDARLLVLHGSGPPPGWVGKVHALYQATRRATGAQYLFLDADAWLPDEGALRRLCERFAALPPGDVLTGLTRLRGGGRLLVSLVPAAILTGLPWPLVRPMRSASLGALNGQCWMIDRDTYHRHEPHRHLPDAVLEDVMIGRYLKARGVTPVLRDVQDEVAVFMYRDFGDAWQGFRKNAYLILGGHPLRFVPLYVLFLFSFVLAPFFSPWFLLSLYVLKAITDRVSRFPPALTLLAPVAYVAGMALQLDSAYSHLTGRVRWKGRQVG